MKKTLTVFSFVLFGLTLLFPVAYLVSRCLGYDFSLTSYPVYTIMLAAFTGLFVVLGFVFKITLESKAARVFLGINAPLSLINAAFLIYKCPETTEVVVILFAAVYVSACILLGILHVKNLSARFGVASASIAAFFLVGGLLFFAMLFGKHFGSVTVDRSMDSPSGKYRAEVVVYDNGALGGSTSVEVVETARTFRALLFKVEKESQKVYWGGWSEHQTIEVRWIDDDRLEINSKEYEIR